MKKLIALIIILCFPAFSFAGTQQIRNVVGMAKAAGGGVWLEQTTGGDSFWNLFDARTAGQGFCVSTGTTLTTITVLTDVNSLGLPVSANARIGVSRDLTSTYLAESTATSITANNTEFTFTFSAPVTITASTQYYFAIASQDASGLKWFNFVTSPSDAYSGACGTDNKIFYWDSVKWNFTGYDYAKDMWFKLQ